MKSISVITLQASTELNTQHIYKLNTIDDLQSGFIPLAVDHRTHQKYQNLLSIPILNTEYDAVFIPRTTVIGTVHPLEIDVIEICDIFWTRTENSNMTSGPAELWLFLLN